MAPSSITLVEEDITDPCVHVELDKLTDYTKEHLTKWLMFGGDSLKGVRTVKDARIR